MNAVASTVIFPGLDITNNPKNPLSGFSSWIFNDYIKSSKLNVSVISTSAVGSGCHLITNNNNNNNDNQINSSMVCDGIYEQIRTCEADFSLFPLSYTDYDYRLPDAPVFNGPQVGATAQILLSFNISESKSYTSYVTLPKFSPYSLIATVILFIILFLVNQINIKLIKVNLFVAPVSTWRLMRMQHGIRPKKATSKYVSKSFFSAFDLRLTKSVWILCLIFSMICFSIILGISQTNMVVKEPPKFFQSIREAALAARKSYKLLAVTGVITTDDFRISKDPALRYLASKEGDSRLVWFQNLDLGLLAETFLLNPSKYFHASADAIIYTVKSFMCNVWISLSPEKKSTLTPPWYLKYKFYLEKPALATYSKCIKPEVRSRLDLIYQRIINSDLWAYYSRDSAYRVPVINERKNMLCVKNAPPFEADEQSSETTEQDTDLLKVLVVIFALPVTGLFFASIILLYEKISHSKELNLGYKKTKLNQNLSQYRLNNYSIKHINTNTLVKRNRYK